MILSRARLVRPEIGLWLALLWSQTSTAPAQQAGGQNTSTFSPTATHGLGTVYSQETNASRLNVEQWGEFNSRRTEHELLDQLTRSETGPGTSRSASLPPALPALGVPVPAHVPSAGLPEHRALWADHAGDSFLMACTSLRRQRQLSGKQTQRLQDFVSTRGKLLDELHQALARAADLPGAEQAAFLARLAATQAAALHDLEAEEESIRLELTQRRAFRPYEDGVGLSVVPSADRKPPPVALGFVFAAQFEPGLTATQRELLLGLVQDMEEAPEQVAASFSFWPARARLPLTAELPADLGLRLQRLQQLKQQLALELIQLLRRLGREAAAAQRRQALADLAARQAPVLAALEALADELRPPLAAIYRMAPPAPVEAPPLLLHQVGQAYARQAALQFRVTAELRVLRQLLPNYRFEVIQQGPAPVIVHTLGAGAGKAPPLTPAEDQALRVRLKETNAELERLTLTLTKDSQALQTAVREYRDKFLQAPERNLRQLAASLGEALAAQEKERLYRDYATAVLQSGLSLEQRRLLLRGTLSEIERARLHNPWVD